MTNIFVDPAAAAGKTLKQMEVIVAGYNVISGCPRSGTSLMMLIHLLIYGADRIFGKQFPQETRRKMLEELLEDEATPELRKYLIDKQLQRREVYTPEDVKAFEDMNPDGFWEAEWSVQGVRYIHRLRDELKKASKQFRITKIVSQGLLNSDPKYIKQVTFMLRHPRSVAKSQERLKRDFPIKGTDGRVHNLFENMILHSPEMFIQVSIQALMFFKEYPDKPVKIIEFEELIENPKKIIDEVYEFNGKKGNVKKGYEAVKPSLNRSKHQDIENDLWGDAEYMYSIMRKLKKLFNQGNRDVANNLIDKALEYMRDPKRAINIKNANWHCYRLKGTTNAKKCISCMTDPETRASHIKQSEGSVGVVADHYMFEPCPFQCGMDVFRKNHLSIEESVEENFWISDEPLDLEKERA